MTTEQKQYSPNFIKIFPNQCLFKDVSEPITEVDNRVLEVIETMKQAVIDFKAFGLAANQIGEELPIVMINGGFKGIMINPKIINQENIVRSSERCLSFPGVEVILKRYKNITVKYLNEDFEPQTIDLEGADAIVVQHEIQHLQGKTIYSEASSFDKIKIMKTINKIRRQIKKYYK